MIFVYPFAISGLAIFILIVAKKWGEDRKRSLFLMRVISKGDLHIREFYHRTVHVYSIGKERISFLVKKRVPMHSRSSLNKLSALLKLKRERLLEKMRDTKLLKKSDGISEFFKSMSEIEKGNGEIHDIYEDSSQDSQKGLK